MIIPRRMVAIATATSVAALVLTACTTPEAPDEDLTLTIALDRLADSAWNVLQGFYPEGMAGQAVYDTLAYWNPTTGVGTPRLAEEWTLSDDRQTLNIKLREDVDFVDGVHFDAAALKKFFDALLVSDYGNSPAYLPYEPTFEVTGEYTLEITTVKPIWSGDFLLTILGSIPILSPTAVDDPDRANAEPLGSGPYVLGDFQADVEMTLVKNPDYWDAERYPFETITLKALADPVAALNALKSGQVDAARIELAYAADAEAAGLNISRGAGMSQMLVVFDPTNSTLEPLRDKRVRQAMMLAFDREAIAESLFLGYSGITSQPFTEGQAEWIEGGDERYGYDLERAKELLAEAGYPDGFDVTIPTGAYPVVEPIIQQSLADIGIRVIYEGDPQALVTQMSGKYPLTIWEFAFEEMLRYIGETFPGVGQFLVPDQNVTDLLTEIKGASPERSAAASQELGEYVLDEAWLIPISEPNALWASTPEVEIDIREGKMVGLYRYPDLWSFQPAA